MSEINCNNCAICDFKESLCDRCDEMKRIGSADDIEKLIIGCLPSAQPDIIRCRDCKHYDPYDSGKAFYCFEGIDECYPDDFCSHAERRTDEQV